LDQAINSVITAFAHYAGSQSTQPMPPPVEPPPPGLPVWVIVLVIIGVVLAGVSAYLWSLWKSRQRIKPASIVKSMSHDFEKSTYIDYMLNEYVAKLLKDNESLILSSIESGSKNTIEVMDELSKAVVSGAPVRMIHSVKRLNSLVESLSGSGIRAEVVESYVSIKTPSVSHIVSHSTS
jgi:hypothetical protein